MRFSALCVLAIVTEASPFRRLLGATNPVSVPFPAHIAANLHVSIPVHTPYSIPVSTPLPVPVHTPINHFPIIPVSNQDCSSFQSCWDCLTDDLCLWDPNALGGGECKPSAQCDFTVAVPRPVHLELFAALPPATACVRDPGQCGIQNFDGAPLDPNPQRGAGCTNSGQCPTGEYCVDCTQCRGQQCWHHCGTYGDVSGFCASASLCQINQDSIDNYCPASAPVSNCLFQDCFSCASATGCVWGGSSCYASSWPCSNPGCANYPSQCEASPIPGGNCAYNDCESCAAGLGCAWSGSSCFVSNSPCNTPGCANYPNQCPSFGSVGGSPSSEQSAEPSQPPAGSFESGGSGEASAQSG